MHRYRSRGLEIPWWRQFSPQALLAGYAVCTLVFLGLLYLWGFSSRWSHSYISEIKDVSYEGFVLILLLELLALLSWLSSLHRRRMAPTALRCALAVAVLMLLLTDSRSPVHVGMFVLSVLLGFSIVVGLGLSLLWNQHEHLAAMVFAVTAVLICWPGSWDPAWQKSLVAFLVASEALGLVVGLQTGNPGALPSPFMRPVGARITMRVACVANCRQSRPAHRSASDQGRPSRRCA